MAVIQKSLTEETKKEETKKEEMKKEETKKKNRHILRNEGCYNKALSERT
uniref:Uncharacterized protein n=1 Tax=Arion vulgaris TaxID=1028688 RepID=A0A0B6ZVM1_9EUPU